MGSFKEQLELYLRARDAYYNGVPILSDADFDDLERLIAEQEPNHPALKLVGAKIRSPETVPLDPPMLSMEKALTDAELLRWVKSRTEEYSPDSFVATPKFDGMSCELRYKDGLLVQAVTRGDGENGQDITAKARYVVPNTLAGAPPSLLVRGEMVLPFAKLEALNRTLPEPLANPRNGVVGLFMEGELQPDKLAFIEFRAFEIPNSGFSRYRYELQALEKFGFMTPYWRPTENSPVEELLKDFADLRPTADIAWDGVVFRMDSTGASEAAGRTSKFWKRAIAWKFPPDVAVVKVTGVEWSLGTREFTPVVLFAPTLLDGAVIQRAGGKSAKNLIELGVFEGAHLELRRSGGVIPWLQPYGTVDKPRAIEWVLASVPEFCSACGTRTTLSGGGMHLSCLNASCHGRLGRQLEVLAKALDIKLLGPANCKLLIAAGLKKLSTLFSGRFDAAGLTSGVAKKLVLEIETARMRTHAPWKLLGSFGIFRLGVDSARKLLNHAGSMDAALLATQNDLKTALGIQDDTLALTMWLSLAEHVPEIREVLASGIKLKDMSASTKNPLPDGKTNIVVTGDLEGCTREEFKERIEAVGVRLASSVSTKTAYLVTNNSNTQTSKAQEARRLGVPIVTQKEIAELLNLS